MGSEWIVTTWGDLVELKYGKGLKGYKDSDGKFPVYGTNGAIGRCDIPLCEYPSVVIGRKGAYRGVHYSPTPFYVIDTAFYMEPKTDLNLKWAYYSLLTQDINGLDSGSAIPSTRREDFYALQAKVPPRSVQDSIVEHLDALNNKIELNRRMNATLEAMAQALFKSWFVDFGPVIDNALAAGNPIPPALRERAELRRALGDNRRPLPADIQQLFPSRFAFNDELGWIPEGWEVKQTKEFGEVICGKTPSKKNADYYGNDVPFIKIPDMHNKVWITETIDNLSFEGANSQYKKEIPSSSICVSCIATVGKVIVTSTKSHTNQQINSVLPYQPVSIFYLYFYFSGMRKELEDLASGGSATLNLNTGNFSRIKILSPPTELLVDYHEATKDLFGKILMNEHQSKSLANLRDTLLPKLISGELRIPEAEKLIEETL